MLLQKETAWISVVCCVNSMEAYDRNVVDSFVDGRVDLISVVQASSAANGLNAGIRKAKCEIVVCCHQDVKFPKGWAERLFEQLNMIGTFGVAGTFGIDKARQIYAGNIKDPHSNPILGDLPCEAMSLDEHCLILRKSNGLRFDEQLGGWHFYGADICLQAEQAGLKNYIIDNRLEHLSGGKVDESFKVMMKKFHEKWKGKTQHEIFSTTCARIILNQEL